MANGDASGLPPENITFAPQFSDEYLALKFTDRYVAILRYTALFSRWNRWNDWLWKADETLEVFSLARTVCKEQAAECQAKARSNTGKEPKSIASAKTVAAVVSLARSDRRHAATKDQWDADPMILNTRAGIIDLRTCDIIPHDPNKYCTVGCPVGTGDNCDLWLAFLDRIMGGNQDLISFLQRMAGYCLTGLTNEHAVFFLYGTGANGKSVFISTLAGIMGEYAGGAPIEIFMESKNDRHPTELAMLNGKRLITSVETEEGRRWNESKLKALTGGDKISARFMRQDFFEFTPQFKLMIAGNHRPSLRSVDEAIRRRMNLIPFNVTIPPAERDPELTEKLKAEWPGILSWALAGTVDWFRSGLRAPAEVRDATEEYLSNEDTIATWIDESCDRNPHAFEPTAKLFKSYGQWCDRCGEFKPKRKQFKDKLTALGMHEDRTGKARGFYGLNIKTYEAEGQSWVPE